MRVWFVTGGSRGLGAALVAAALARGDAVVATARDAAAVAPRENLLTVAADVTDPESVRAAVDAALTRFGRIDVLVNNAGVGVLGAVEEVSDAEARAAFDVNVFGLLTVTRAVLPVLRGQGGGHVVTVSSAGGFCASAGWGVYNATKFAAEGISEALAAEAAPHGVRVLIVEPGDFRTAFLDRSLTRAATALPAYAHLRAGVDGRSGTQAGDPARFAAAVLAAVDAPVTSVGGGPTAPLRLVLGADALGRVEAKLARTAAELDAWRDVGVATGFPVHA